MAATTPALRIHELYKSYSGTPVVNNLSLQIEPGEIFGLLGPNGAGKSTTINIISGVSRLERGKVEVFGYDNQTGFKQTRRMVGVMHQEIVIDPFFKIGIALKIHSGYYGVPDDPAWRNLLIERLDLGPHLHKSMNKLSGGMKRRFMVAKALIHKPRLLILDEPTAGVDVNLRRALWEFVRLINQQGTTVLLTTHYLAEAEEMCGRIGIMNHGELVGLDTTRNLMSRLDQRKLEVRLRESLPVVPAALESLHPLLKEGGAVWEFSLSKGTDAGMVLGQLYAQRIALAEVETRSASLEEVFLSLTREPTPAVRTIA